MTTQAIRQSGNQAISPVFWQSGPGIRTLLILAFFTVAGCFSPEHHGELSFGDGPVPQEPYSKTLDRWTTNEKVYNGLSSAFEVTATLLSTDVLQSQTFVKAEELHWTPDQYKQNRDDALKAAQDETTFFLALYTEKEENNNLDRSSTDWNVFVDVDGKHISPTSIKRTYETRAKITSQFPYFNPWSRGYYIKFPVPTSSLTEKVIILTIASPLGASHLKFPKEL